MGRSRSLVAGIALVAAGAVAALGTAGALHGPASAAAAGAEARMRQVALGVSMWDGRDIGRLDAFRASIGGQAPALWTIWSQWGEPSTKSFPTDAAVGARARGAVPVVWWEPMTPSDRSDPTYARHANIAAGLHDAYIRDFARHAKRFGSTLVLRLAHEGNSSYFPWGAGQFDNTAQTFVAAWRHVHGIFRSVGATNVRFLWSIAKKTCPGGCNPYMAFYPGDEYVDYLGFSSFNWGAQREGWVSMLQGFARVTRLLGQVSPKPIIAIETASNSDGGDKPAWIAEGYPAVYEELPRIVAIVYLDVDLRAAGHPDWRLESPPAALAAYADIAAMPIFGGRLPGT